MDQIGTFSGLDIILRARLTCPPVWLVRQPDCTLYQIARFGHFARLARLALGPECQIGMFARLGVSPLNGCAAFFVRASARLGRMPDCSPNGIYDFGAVYQIGICSPDWWSPDWNRLTPLARLPDWTRQIGARLASTTQQFYDWFLPAHRELETLRERPSSSSGSRSSVSRLSTVTLARSVPDGRHFRLVGSGTELPWRCRRGCLSELRRLRQKAK